MNPVKGIASPGWLVSDISEGRTIRNLRKTLIKAGVIPLGGEDRQPERKRQADVPEAELTVGSTEISLENKLRIDKPESIKI